MEQSSKEEANDYRYFPEPDLPVLQFTKEYLDKLRSEMPELPAHKRARFKSEYNLDDAAAENLINWKELTFYFEEVVSEIDEWIKETPTTPSPFGRHPSLAGGEAPQLSSDRGGASPPDKGEYPAQRGEGVGGVIDRNVLIKQAANWCLQDFSAMLNAKLINPQDSAITPENFAELLKLIQQGKISGSAAKQVFKVMFEKGGEPLSIINDLGLHQVSDVSVTISAIDKVMKDIPKAVADFKAGQQKAFGSIVGAVMKEMGGKGNPQVINELLKEKLK